MEKKKIALFHPWIKSRGGAEKVVLEIVRNSNQEVDVYTWVYDKKNTFREFEDIKINIISPKIFSKLKREKILRGIYPFLPFNKKIPLERYDKFLISTSGIGEFITFRNYKKNKTYAYIHTPLREANEKIVKWNLNNHYHSFLRKQIYLFAVKIYRILERKAWRNLNFLIFNSELSYSRANEHHLIKSQKTCVIYPPIIQEKIKRYKKTKKDFIYVSRLNNPKRQDILIESWKLFSKKNPEYNLIFVGDIENKSYHKKLLKMSKGIKSITFLEKLSKMELERLISESFAGIFLGYQEDFGLVPLEIISAGKPLIAVDEGGYTKLIENHPLFHKIKEKHNSKEMIEEVTKELEGFIKKDYSKAKSKKIKLNNFIEEIEEVIGE